MFKNITRVNKVIKFSSRGLFKNTKPVNEIVKPETEFNFVKQNEEQ